MSLRIAVGGLNHETNTYRSDTTSMSSFFIRRGAEISEWIANTDTYPAGMLDAIADAGNLAVPTFFASANPAGLIEAETYRSLREELLTHIESAMPLDGVALFLHGAGAAECEDDIEGDVARSVRAIVGEGVPIVAAMDLHGNVSDAMVEALDVVLPDHDYPHTGMYERGYTAAALVPRIRTGEVRPAVHTEALPMVMPPTPTTEGMGADLKALLGRLARQNSRVVDCSVFHGFGYADTPWIGTRVVVTTHDDSSLAIDLAKQVAQWIWENRERCRHEAPSADEAVSQAMAIDGGPVIINEAGDNPGAGGPGDSTHLLRAILAAKPASACFGFICDPGAVLAAESAGVGATFALELGGHFDDRHGQPIETEAYVKSLSDGTFALRAMSAGLTWHLGKMARLIIDGVDVLVSSVPEQTLDPAVFELHGINVNEYRIVGLKSHVHFKAGFSSIARQIITADTPGLTMLDLSSLPERIRSPRPLWPIDPGAEYSSSAERAS